MSVESNPQLFDIIYIVSGLLLGIVIFVFIAVRCWKQYKLQREQEQAAQVNAVETSANNNLNPDGKVVIMQGETLASPLPYGTAPYPNQPYS